MARRLLIAALLIVAAWKGHEAWLLRPVDRAPGIVAPDEPRQTPLERADAFKVGDFALTPLAGYQLRARLLSRHPYRFGRESKLSPLDFAIGWGPMSDSALLEQLEISQSVRYFTLHWRDPSLSAEEILGHAANMHLIPADSNIARALDRMRPGEIIELEGYLVSATASDGWSWRSSLTRADRGAGACELMWVAHARSS